MKNIIKNHLQDKFKEKESFSTQEIIQAIKEIFPVNKKSTYSWWIHKLKKENFIYQNYRGRYAFNVLEVFKPRLTPKTVSLIENIQLHLPKKNHLSVFELRTLTELLDVVPTRDYVFIHVEKRYLENVYHELQTMDKRVFWQPKNEVIRKYVLPVKEAIFLYPYLKGMPMYQHENYNSYTLESILIHSYIYGEEFCRFRGIKIDSIFVSAFQKYNVSISSLLRNAARRNKKHEIIALLEKNHLI